MPQIWMTYDELAELLDCDRATARGVAAAVGLDRRKSRDGHTRAKLNSVLMQAFLDRLTRQRLKHQLGEHETAEYPIGEREITAAVGELRAIAAQMARRSPERPDVRASDGDGRASRAASWGFGIGD